MLIKYILNKRNLAIKFFNYTRMKAQILIIFLISAILLTSCGSKKQGPSSENQSSGSTNKSDETAQVDDELEELEKDIEKIIRILDGPSSPLKDKQEENKNLESTKTSVEGASGDTGSEEKKPEKDKKSEGDKKEENTEDKKEQQQDKDSGKNEQGKDEQNKDKNQQSKATEKNPWLEIAPIINKMHFTWGTYAPKATEKGANSEMINAFSSSLNGLTNSIISKDKDSTLISANNCYGDITKLFSVYKKQNVSEIKKLKYYTRNIVLASFSSDWTQANSNMKDLKTVWGFLENSLGEENKDIIDALRFSIMELEKVVIEKNQPLTNIKGSITLSVIEDIGGAKYSSKGHSSLE